MTSSPTFIARFVDGEVVRMTTYHDDERKTLDLKRGVRLARWAYFSRKKQEPPMIESASFERSMAKRWQLTPPNSSRRSVSTRERLTAAGQGQARLGAARRGRAWRGKARIRRGPAWRGLASPSQARQGKAGRVSDERGRASRLFAAENSRKK